MTLAFIGNRNQRLFFFLIDILFSQFGYFKFFTLLYVLSSACKCQLSYSTHLSKEKKRKEKGYCNFLRVCVKSMEQFGENQLFCILNLPMHAYYSVQSVAQSCLTLHNPMDYSTPGFPVPHQLLELTQTHVHQVGDAIQPYDLQLLTFKNSVSHVLCYLVYRAFYTFIKHKLKYLISFGYYFKWNYV